MDQNFFRIRVNVAEGIRYHPKNIASLMPKKDRNFIVLKAITTSVPTGVPAVRTKKRPSSAFAKKLTSSIDFASADRFRKRNPYEVIHHATMRGIP